MINSKRGDSQEIATQYHVLARSLAKGQVYLDIEPSKELVSLSNPYDAPLRDSILKRDEGYLGDYALFEGKYYCYFGILPVITTFLPYYILTGAQLPFSISTSIYASLLIVGIFSLFYKIFQIYFKDSPFCLYIIACWTMIFGSGLFFAFRAVKFYALPILCAACLSIWGLYFWLRSLNKTKIDFIFNVAIGTLCISLTALSRPQFLITFLFGIVIFKEYIDQIFTKHKLPWKLILAVVLPATVIALITMYYNYSRFHSVFDFGANYNLCSNDMRYRGWHWDRLGLAIFYYLFSPVIIKPTFPFLEHNELDTNYLGVTIFEEMYGGYFALMPFFLISFLAFSHRLYFRKKESRLFSCLSLSLAIIVLIVDAQMSGIVARYRMDFGWLIAISAIFVILEIEYSTRQNIVRNIMRVGICSTLFVAILYELFLIFDTVNIARWWHPHLFFTIKSLVQFWG